MQDFLLDTTCGFPCNWELQLASKLMKVHAQGKLKWQHTEAFSFFFSFVMLHAQVTISVFSQIWQYSECASRNSYAPFHIVSYLW